MSTQEELENLLKYRVSSLLDMLKEHDPSLVVQIQIKMVVAVARVLYGRENIDKDIDKFQIALEAQEFGVCERCHKHPATQVLLTTLFGYQVCDDCKKEIDNGHDVFLSND